MGNPTTDWLNRGFFSGSLFKNLNIKHLIHPITTEILPLWHLRFYDSLIRFKKLRVTCLSWLIWTMTSCAAPINIGLHSFPCCSVPLVWVGILVGKGNTSLNCCVLSFDKFCYTRIQVSVKDLDPSTILQSLNECKKEIERYRHESWMSSGLWLHGLFVSETEFPIYTSSFQAAFYVLMLPLFYLCLFIVSGISCYKSCHKSSLEALKVFVFEQS